MKAICEECGKMVEIHDEQAYNARVTRFFVCDECLAKTEIDDPLVEMYGFPKLQGSRKQIEWAVSIRAKSFKKFSKGNRKKHIADDFRTQGSAAWWIENR